MVHRVHNQKQNHVDRLKGMASLARIVVKKAKDYKVVFEVETDRTAPSIDLKDLQKEEKLKKERRKRGDESDDDAKWGDSSAVIGYTNGRRKKLKVNCFSQKDDTKAMMIQDNCLWARRPLPINLLLYAAVDGWLTYVIGQYYRKRLKQLQIDKTMLVSLRWCRMVASKKSTRRGSARVNPAIVKLIRSNTMGMDIDDIPHIDGTKTIKKKSKAIKLVTLNTCTSRHVNPWSMR